MKRHGFLVCAISLAAALLATAAMSGIDVNAGHLGR
jgi:hypothetical protein